MRQNIWIWNHYATNTFKDKAGRHYWFAENLVQSGYNPTIFCASTIHNSNEIIDTKGERYITDSVNNVPFVFINTPDYNGNGKKRIFNMIMFYINLFPVARKYAKENGKPDVIIASSVHPLTLIAGIKIAKRFGVPCICEVRDLWPESIVAYGSLKRNSIIAKILYKGEKWIYKQADKLIFTMEGGKDYIIEQGWDNENCGPIDISKVYHINNGVDLEGYNYSKEHYRIEDKDLDNTDLFKVIYTGSIRKVNNVLKIVKTAEYIQKKNLDNIIFLIYGDGDERPHLEKYCYENNIKNVVLKGRVEKKFVPYILDKSNLNIIHSKQNELNKYGASLNKMFEYFASGKATISDCEFGYDLIKRYQCGIVVDNASEEDLAEAILTYNSFDDADRKVYEQNAKNASEDYDFKNLTKKLINIIEGTNKDE